MRVAVGLFREVASVGRPFNFAANRPCNQEARVVKDECWNRSSEGFSQVQLNKIASPRGRASDRLSFRLTLAFTLSVFP